MAKRPPKLTVISSSNEAADPVSETDEIRAGASPSEADQRSRPENEAPATGQAVAALFSALKRDAKGSAKWILPRLRSSFFRLGASATNAFRRATLRDGSEVPESANASKLTVSNEEPLVAEAATVDHALSRKPWTWRKRLAVCVLTSGLLLFVSGLALAAWALHDVPLDEIAEGSVDSQVISLAASDGEPIIQLGPYREVAAAREEFPDHLVDAVLAIEDRRFYEHWGIDPWGLVRAASRNLLAGEVREGGSTITQQLLKVLYLDQDRTLRRKVQEVFLSLWLEHRLSKDEILTLYLNNVYMGAGATGLPAAARVYFDKTVAELTIAEGAMLAGLIASPSALNPLENLDAAKERASVVLGAMRSAGTLEESAELEARLNSAKLKPERPQLATGTWFADWAMQEAQAISGQFLGSVKVTTTLVPELQTLAEQTVRTVMGEQGAKSGAGQAAMVVLAPDGAVLAMVGGLDYTESQFNRALAMRQPGSTFKLFTYYAALKLGASPDLRIDDEPFEIGGWSPENIDGDYNGRVSMAEAFARSLNVATVRLGIEVGLPNIVAAARELGIDAPLQETPSLILGTSEVSLLDMTGAYASVRGGVVPVEPYAIRTFEAASGQPFSIGARVKPSTPIQDVHETMLGLLQLVVEQGTAQAARLDRFAAGKTGTSQDYRDAWFIGFDQNYTVGVWIGNDDSSPMDEVTGGELPAVIWQRFMGEAAGSAQDLPLPSIANQSVQETAPTQCNIQACSQAYRSFRASDCTFQPYRGARRICER